MWFSLIISNFYSIVFTSFFILDPYKYYGTSAGAISNPPPPPAPSPPPPLPYTPPSKWRRRKKQMKVAVVVVVVDLCGWAEVHRVEIRCVVRNGWGSLMIVWDLLLVSLIELVRAYGAFLLMSLYKIVKLRTPSRPAERRRALDVELQLKFETTKISGLDECRFLISTLTIAKLGSIVILLLIFWLPLKNSKNSEKLV